MPTRDSRDRNNRVPFSHSPKQMLNPSREQPRDDGYYPVYRKAADKPPTAFCGGNEEFSLNWEVSNATTRAYIIEECDGSSTEIDLTVDSEGNGSGSQSKSAGCCYTVVAVNECGTAKSQCPCACDPPEVSCSSSGEDHAYTIENAREAYYIESCYSGASSSRVDIGLDSEGNASGTISGDPLCCYTFHASNECGSDSASCNCPDPTEDPPTPCCNDCIVFYCITTDYSMGGDGEYPAQFTSQVTGNALGEGTVVDPNDSFGCCVIPGSCGIAILNCGVYVMITNNACICPPPPPCPPPTATCTLAGGSVYNYTVGNASSAKIIEDCNGVIEETDIPLDGNGDASGTFTAKPCCTYTIVASNYCDEVTATCGSGDEGFPTAECTKAYDGTLEWIVTNADSAKIIEDCDGVITETPIVLDGDGNADGTITPDPACCYTIEATNACGTVTAECDCTTTPATCCCDVVDGFSVTIMNVTNELCENCTELNKTVLVPKLGGSLNTCSGTTNFGISSCSGVPVNGVLTWTLTCNPDGQVVLEVNFQLGFSNEFTISETFPAGTDCCDLSVSQTGGAGGDTNCNFASASLTLQAYGDTC